jgi:hypothetical protein
VSKSNEEGKYTGPPVRTGSFGPFPREQVYARWIEDHDRGTEVNYICRDEKKWPNGCWKIEAKNCEPQYVGPKGLEYIAVELLKCEKLEGVAG